MASRPQKGKNRKRPRAWHRGPKAFELQEKPLKRVEAAIARAGDADAELAETRRRGRDETEVWQALERVNPPAGLELPRWL